LKRLSRTVKADGFRTASADERVAQRYGYSVHYEVVNDRVGEAFNSAHRSQAARAPAAHHAEGRAPEASSPRRTFEVYPEVKIGDLKPGRGRARLTEVTDAAIDARSRSCASSAAPSAAPAAEGAQETDRVTIDFEGKIDANPSPAARPRTSSSSIGEGQMLEQFDSAVRGMKVGESKTFPLHSGRLPRRRRGRQGGRLMVTVKKIEPRISAVDDALAKSLGIKEARSKDCAPTSGRTGA